MTQNIILTGFMGTGKTAVGKLLAEKLGYDFFDTDTFIETRHGRTIPQIFAQSGEAAFRVMEREVTLKLAGREGLVISTGGHLMLDPINAAELMRNGRVFCLTANPEEILARLSKGNFAQRPLLAGPNPAQRIAKLLAERQEGYNRFEQVATDGLMIAEVAEIIYKKIILY
jgi:shikimate kinase